MFIGLVGLTAIEVSLCGPTDSSVQSVLTLAAVEVEVVQIAVPVLTGGEDPNTPPATGAGAFTTLCVKSRGCWLPSAATPSVCPSATAAIPNRIKKGTRLTPQPPLHAGGRNQGPGSESNAKLAPDAPKPPVSSSAPDAHLAVIRAGGAAMTG